MPQIKYVGTAHFRELGSEDFKKFGADGQKKHTFARDEPTEVTDAVAKVLIDRLPDEFARVEEKKSAPMASQSKQGA